MVVNVVNVVTGINTTYWSEIISFIFCLWNLCDDGKFECSKIWRSFNNQLTIVVVFFLSFVGGTPYALFTIHNNFFFSPKIRCTWNWNVSHSHFDLENLLVDPFWERYQYRAAKQTLWINLPSKFFFHIFYWYSIFDIR